MGGSCSFACFKLCGLGVVAIYSTIILVVELSKDYSKLEFSSSPPSDRCVRLFKDAGGLHDLDGQVALLYDYRQGTADLRVCTNLDQATVDGVVGSSNEYDALSASSCDLSNPNDVAILEASSTTEDTNLTVAEVLATPPTPYGWQWEYGVADLGCHCCFNFRYLGNPPCTNLHVYGYRTTNGPVHAFLIFSLVLQVVMELAMLALWKDGKQEDEEKRAFASQGVVGLLWVIYHAVWRREPISMESAECKSWGFALHLLSDVATGLVYPLVAISGCAFFSIPELALMCLAHCGIICYNVVMFLYRQFCGNKTSTSGSSV